MELTSPVPGKFSESLKAMCSRKCASPVAPAVSLRENERGVHIGSGWDPHWHQPTDIYANFSDKDFLLGLNAAQTTLGAVAELAGTRMKE